MVKGYGTREESRGEGRERVREGEGERRREGVCVLARDTEMFMIIREPSAGPGTGAMSAPQERSAKQVSGSGSR